MPTDSIFATSLSGLVLEAPIIVAAGMIKTMAQVRTIAPSLCAAVTIGSVTVEPRQGNQGDIYHFDADRRVSLNALGMPNAGIETYGTWLPEMVDIAHSHGKPLILSVAGFTPDEYGTLAYRGFEGGADIVELNLGCPNVWHGSTQHRIASFDPEAIAAILSAVAFDVGAERRVAVKLSPYTDPSLLTEVAAVLAGTPLVKVVIASNTFPNGLALGPSGKLQIGVGLAGAAGPGFFAAYLGQVRQMRALLPDRVDIVGVGGIWHGQDVLDMQHAGAAICGIATAYMERRERAFTEIITELADATA